MAQRTAVEELETAGKRAGGLCPGLGEMVGKVVPLLLLAVEGPTLTDVDRRGVVEEGGLGPGDFRLVWRGVARDGGD